MMLADLPPSSMVVAFRPLAAEARMARPVVVPPVKDTTSTEGCSTSATPVTGPRPLTRFTTPGGRPAACTISMKRCMPAAATSEGLTTQLLPKAMAAATFIEHSVVGAFHGPSRAATPTGSRVTVVM